MKIGIYGHSFMSWERKQEFSFISLLRDHFDATILSYGVPQSSEERILFDIKKSKKIDLAIIAHARPDYHFVPSLRRDFDTFDRDSLIKKIPTGKAKDWFKFHGFEDVPEQFCKFWESIPNQPCYSILKELDLAPEFFEDSITNFSGSAFDAFINNDYSAVKSEISKKMNLENLTEDYLELFEAFRLYKKYMYDHDMQMSRYYGALIQIDMYLAAKKIPVVHILDKKEWIPKWFNFTSGVQTMDLLKYQHELGGYWVPYSESDNSVNLEGNKIVFEKLLDLINNACAIV
jgi:hypothetical protein